MKLKNITYTLIAQTLFFSPLMFGAAPAAAPKRSLKDYKFKGAVVLPITAITKIDPQTKASQEVKYFLLGRERHKKTWNAFGGDRDPQENHPEMTAGRELYEETAGALFTSPDDTIKYINIDKGHTQAIIAHRGGVNYITAISKDKSKKFVKEFYPALKKAKSKHMREMDAIALVREDKLQSALAQGKLEVDATIIGENGKNMKETINLRPFFVKVMQPYFVGKKGTLGKNSKIIFYD